MFSEIVVAEKTIEALWEHRALISRIASDTYELVSKGQLSVFAFGLGGTGKTTLGKLLSGKYGLSEVPSSYNVSLEVETYKVGRRTFATLYVPPGQEDKQDVHWDDLKKKMAKANRYVVFNIVCGGYHSLAGIELNRVKLHDPGMSDDEFMRIYLADRQASEIASLESLVPHLNSAPGRLRMITLVTKQDLWWEDRKNLREHYTKGKYSRLLDKIIKHRGGAQFDHDFVSCSLNILNFATSEGHILAKTVAGYDSSLWIANYNRVIESIRSILDR